MDDLERREKALDKRLKKLEALEAQIKDREKAVKEKESKRKQVLIRIAPSLWDDIAAWAEEDFRSFNGQVEYLLAKCVRERKGGK